MSPFDPHENIRIPKVFRCFQRDQKGPLGRKELMKNAPLMKNALIFDGCFGKYRLNVLFWDDI